MPGIIIFRISAVRASQRLLMYIHHVIIVAQSHCILPCMLALWKRQRLLHLVSYGLSPRLVETVLRQVGECFGVCWNEGRAAPEDVCHVLVNLKLTRVILYYDNQTQ